jgi:preprotein translocase subunit SecB
MAQDDTQSAPPNGNGATGNGATGGPPQLTINAQYIKDLSFENPRAPQSLIQQKAAPEVGLEVDVKAVNLAPDLYEVVLTISAEAKSEGETVFIAQLAYAAVVTAKNVSEEMLRGLIFIETPRLLFPFARNVIATATREGGFPPLLINPIDFTSLLRREHDKGGQTALA